MISCKVITEGEMGTVRVYDRLQPSIQHVDRGRGLFYKHTMSDRAVYKYSNKLLLAAVLRATRPQPSLR